MRPISRRAWSDGRNIERKPVLFVMMNDTADADDVGDWLREKYPPEFGGDKLLIIHTDRSGDVSRKDLDIARKASREVDDERSPINCIVSVLMLREGWDVQSVTVIVGLRPYTSKANILPEQTVGRGLRLMGYTERVDVIGNKTFIDFVEQLEREEDIQLETFNIGETPYRPRREAALAVLGTRSEGQRVPGNQGVRPDSRA
jgi:type III restriction enzyme